VAYILGHPVIIPMVDGRAPEYTGYV